MPDQTVKQYGVGICRCPLCKGKDWNTELLTKDRDETLALGLLHGWIDVDVGTGKITDPRSGREVRSLLHPKAGLGFMYSFRKNGQDRYYTNRLIAIKRWGLAAVRKKEVREDPIQGLVVQNHGASWIKQEWERCAICGTSGGFIGKRHVTPNRYSAEPFGISGELCTRCYFMEHRARKRGYRSLNRKERGRTGSAGRSVGLP
jgi:hypothetical protein